MPKLELIFVDQVSVLTLAGTLDQIKAIAYYRGDRGHYAPALRDFIDKGIRDFYEALSPKERARYDEILANVRVMNNPPG